MEDWGKLLDDVVAISTMLDRLLHQGTCSNAAAQLAHQDRREFVENRMPCNGYPDSVEKDWGARFENRPIRGKFSKIAAVFAGSYWALTITAFLILQLAGFDMIGPGAVFIALLTVPLSVLMFLAHPSLTLDPVRPDHNLLASSIGTLILLPLICGGVNALAIYWLVGAIQRRRRHKT